MGDRDRRKAKEDRGRVQEEIEIENPYRNEKDHQEAKRVSQMCNKPFTWDPVANSKPTSNFQPSARLRLELCVASFTFLVSLFFEGAEDVEVALPFLASSL